MSWCKSGCLHTNCLCMVFLTRFLTLTVADTVVLHELGTNSDLRSGLAHTLKTGGVALFQSVRARLHDAKRKRGGRGQRFWWVWLKLGLFSS